MTDEPPATPTPATIAAWQTAYRFHRPSKVSPHHCICMQRLPCRLKQRLADRLTGAGADIPEETS